MTAQEAFARLEGVQRELLAARFAVERVLREVDVDPTPLAQTSPRLKPSHLRECGINLDVSYLLRLFAEFEAVLRDFLAAKRPSPRPRRTRMEILMERVAMIVRVPAEVVQAAHAVREHRNALMHNRGLQAALGFPECKSRLARFVSHLPRTW